VGATRAIYANGIFLECYPKQFGFYIPKYKSPVIAILFCDPDVILATLFGKEAMKLASPTLAVWGLWPPGTFGGTILFQLPKIRNTYARPFKVTFGNGWVIFSNLVIQFWDNFIFIYLEILLLYGIEWTIVGLLATDRLVLYFWLASLYQNKEWEIRWMIICNSQRLN